MPDPPVMKSRWLLVGVAGLSAQDELALGLAEVDDLAGLGRHEVLRDLALVVGADGERDPLPGTDAAEEIVKQRVIRRAEPGRSRPTWTYWPAR